MYMRSQSDYKRNPKEKHNLNKNYDSQSFHSATNKVST